MTLSHTVNGRATKKRQRAKWHKTEKGRLARLRAKRKYRLKYREKRRAHRLVAKAVARGELIRPSACTRCLAGGPIEAHHPDYSKPLDVVWICVECHLKEHEHQQRKPLILDKAAAARGAERQRSSSAAREGGHAVASDSEPPA